MVEKWFPGFKRHSGFDKDATVERNLNVMYKNAKLSTPEKKWLRVGRQAQALANITADRVTKNKANSVATAAFKRLAKLQKEKLQKHLKG